MHIYIKYTHLPHHFFEAQLKGLALTMRIFHILADASAGHFCLSDLSLVDFELSLVLHNFL